MDGDKWRILFQGGPPSLHVHEFHTAAPFPSFLQCFFATTSRSFNNDTPLRLAQQESTLPECGHELYQTVLHIQSLTRIPKTFIRCPPETSAATELGLKHPWMHIQTRSLGREWSFEVGLVDRASKMLRVRCSTFQAATLAAATNTAVDDAAEDDAHEQQGAAYDLPSSGYSHISYIKIYATCRLWQSGSATTQYAPPPLPLPSSLVGGCSIVVSSAFAAIVEKKVVIAVKESIDNRGFDERMSLQEEEWECDELIVASFVGSIDDDAPPVRLAVFNGQMQVIHRGGHLADIIAFLELDVEHPLAFESSTQRTTSVDRLQNTLPVSGATNRVYITQARAKVVYPPIHDARKVRGSTSPF
ncbi:Cilia-and flagella-associated protein [Salix suchowensis]|nr:Cilia-and flagella-associated protein [Salix suchowensis]